jgi:hypothetical protein
MFAKTSEWFFFGNSRCIPRGVGRGASEMVAETRSLAEVTEQAIRLLYTLIGIVDTARFIGQFSTGYGDYTRKRETLFADRSVDDLIDAIKRHRSEQDTTNDG